MFTKWGWKNAVGGSLGVVQVSAGGVILFFSGGLLAPVGTGLLSSGTNSIFYSASTSKETFTVSGYTKQIVVGATIGATTAGIGALGSATVIVDKLGSTAATVIMNTAGGAVGQVTGELADSAIDWRTPDLSAKSVASGALAGCVGGAFSANSAAKVAEKTLGNTVKTIAAGAGAGATVGAAATITDNALHNRDLSDNVLKSVTVGAVIGGALGGMQAAPGNPGSAPDKKSRFRFFDREPSKPRLPKLPKKGFPIPKLTSASNVSPPRPPVNLKILGAAQATVKDTEQQQSVVAAKPS